MMIQTRHRDYFRLKRLAMPSLLGVIAVPSIGGCGGGGGGSVYGSWRLEGATGPWRRVR